MARSLGVALFVAQFVALDLVLTGAGAWLHRSGSVRAAIASLALWLAVLAVARRWRAARVVVALFAASLLVLQVFVYRVVHVPFELQVAEAARHSYGAIRGSLVETLPFAALTALVVAAVEFALLELGRLALLRRRLGLRVDGALLVVAALAIALGPEARLAAPDVRALDALRILREPPPRAVVGAVALPALHPIWPGRATSGAPRPTMPDVMFILTESVRALDYVPRGPEATAPEAAAATPGRFELDELRAISSYTAISLSAMITGHSQQAGRDEVLKAPNLFDFAHAAGADVGYYSAQSRETFETKDVRAAIDHFVTLETLAGHDIEDDAEWVLKPLDRMVVDRFAEELPARGHPSVTVIQLYGTHAPYLFDDDTARFVPFERAVGWSAMPKLRNAYKNAIVEQDRQVARAVRAFVAAAEAGHRPWLVLFTSDHGEAFGEHSAIHHGQNLYDEQVRVPGWIAAAADVLGDEERKNLEDHRHRFVTHLDLLPTILDVLGLAENFSVRPYLERMAGGSLLRPHVAHPPIPVTNCTGMFPCPLNTWGLFAEDHKLIAQVWDAEWRCLDVSGGEHLVPFEDPACVALRVESRRHFPRLPNGEPNR